MENAGYIALSNQVALYRQMDIIANNIANVNTTGFKAQSPLFEEFLAKPDVFKREFEYSYVADIGIFRDFDDGTMVNTGNQLDVAINGPGFFQVVNDNGDELFTRGGRFSVDNVGRLVDGNGNPVQTAGGGEIIIGDEARTISIARDGTINVDGEAIGTIGIFEFENRQLLEKQGDLYYRPTADLEAEAAAESALIQGYFEGSNVNAITSISNMIRTQRAFEATQALLDEEHEKVEKLLQRLGRSQQ